MKTTESAPVAVQIRDFPRMAYGRSSHYIQKVHRDEKRGSMAYIVVRVELHGAVTEDQYQRLHAAMQRSGFARTIVAATAPDTGCQPPCTIVKRMQTLHRREMRLAKQQLESRPATRSSLRADRAHGAAFNPYRAKRIQTDHSHSHARRSLWQKSRSITQIR